MDPQNEQNDLKLTPQELRETAQFMEYEVLDALADYSDITFPNALGDLKVFPRPSPQDQAAQQGFVILRESTEQVISVLYALAAALDNNRAVPDALLAPLMPYIQAYRAERRRHGEASRAGEKRGRMRKGSEAKRRSPKAS
jgi:hypothetical protein